MQTESKQRSGKADETAAPLEKQEPSTRQPETQKQECPGPFTVRDVLAEELARLRPEIKDLKSAGIPGIFDKLSEAGLTALSLSGGGIRSATFALGVIQGLASRGILSRLDYLSTVSGGGYIGTWLSGWNREELVCDLEKSAAKKINKRPEDFRTPEERRQLDDMVAAELFANGGFAKGPLATSGIEKVQAHLAKGDWPASRKIDCRDDTPKDRNPPTNPEPKPVRHLREYSNYMTPKVGIFSADTWALFGIYLRNLFLNWTIFLPLLAALLLVPVFLRSTFLWLTMDWTLRHPQLEHLNTVLIIIAFAAGVFSLWFVATRLPSKAGFPFPNMSDEVSVLWMGVVPQFVLAFCASAYWWNKVLPTASSEYLSALVGRTAIHGDLYLVTRVTFFSQPIIFLTAVFALGYVLFAITNVVRELRYHTRGFKAAAVYTINIRTLLFGLVTSTVGGLLLSLASGYVFDFLDWIGLDEAPHVTTFFCIATPIFLVCTLLQSAIFIGLASGETSDGDREWMARYGGWILLGILVWLLFNVGMLITGKLAADTYYWASARTPDGKDWMISRWYTGLAGSFATIVGIFSALASLVGGFSSKFPVRKNPDGSRKQRFLSIIPQIGSAIFLAIIMTALSYATTKLLAFLTVEYLRSAALWFPGAPSSLARRDVIQGLTPGAIAAFAGFLTLIGGAMAVFVNVNRFSLHGAYRDRLVRAYLGASNLDRKADPFTGFDEADNRQLHRLKEQKPYHILNATLNLVSSSNLAWQDRKATSFTMSPLYCGSERLGYRPSNQYSRNEKLPKCPHIRYCNRMDEPCEGGIEKCQYPGQSLRLGTSMAISGAAADPNMGYYSSALVSFVMSLFNIRLGWWLGNTGCRGNRGDWPKFFPMRWLGKLLGVEVKQFFKRTDPTFAVWPLLNETLGRTSEERRYLNVTDGGHFENLALYEMVRRRCRFILVSDAAADQGFTFGELANAVEKCQVDLGVQIKIPETIEIYSRDADDEKRRNGRRYLLAEIIYPERKDPAPEERSWLLYCRPTLRGTEPVDIAHYAATNSSFPHQSTGDQFFDERQFEAYRRLGRLTCDEMLCEPDVRKVLEAAGLLEKPEVEPSPRPFMSGIFGACD